MELEDDVFEKGMRRLSYTQYRHTDFIERALLIELDDVGIPQKLEFNSTQFGTIEWHSGKGLKEPHLWESEDEAQEGTFLTRNYPSILEDGIAPEEHGKNRIIPDIISHLPLAIAKQVKEIIRKKVSRKPFRT